MATVPASASVAARPRCARMRADAASAGVNRFVWDMRVIKPTLMPKAVFNEGTKAPPKIAPGTYKARLTVGGQSYTEAIEVVPHPAGYATAADLKAQYDLLKSIRDRLSQTHETVMKIRDVRAQVTELGDRTARLGKGDALQKQAAAIVARLTAVEEKLTNPQIKSDEDDLNYEPRLDHDWTYLAAIVASADAKPTPSSVQYYALLKGRLDAVRYKAPGFSDMWILVQTGESVPSEGHAIDHIGWRSTGPLADTITGLKTKGVTVTSEPRPLPLPNGPTRLRTKLSSARNALSVGPSGA
jgi:hypothetical protein